MRKGSCSSRVRLPGNKVGRQWRLRRSDLDRLLAGASIVAEAAVPYAAHTGAPQTSQARRALLREELHRFIRYAVPALNPARIIVFGTMVSGEVHAWSDLDLAVVAETELPFLERARKILKEFQPRVGLDVLVYTHAEWEQLQERPFVREEIMKKGRVIHER